MFLLVCLVLIVCPREAAEGAREGLRVALELVLPSILPFSVFATAFIMSGGAEKAARYSGRFFKSFMGVNPYSAAAFFAGALGGYPTGCKVVCQMCQKGLVSRTEAERMLAFCNNGGLAFALTVGKSAFGGWKEGIILYAAGVVSAMITGAVMAKSREETFIAGENKKTPLLTVMGKSIASGGGVVMNVVASFIVFYALINALRLDKILFLSGCAELTGGIMKAGGVKNLPLAALFFSFGGLCVFAQSAAICAEENLSVKRMIAGKSVSALIAFVGVWVMGRIQILGKSELVLTLFAFVAILCCVKIIKAVHAKA